jgi:Restriction endonuclease
MKSRLAGGRMREFELPPDAQRLLDEVRSVEEEAERIRQRLERDLDRARKDIDCERAETERAREVVETLIRDRVSGFELIAQAWAEYEQARSGTLAEQLRRKTRPALKAADEVRSKGRELAEARRGLKVAEYLVALYEFHFPWLEEFRDLEAELDYVQQADTPTEEEDPAARFLSKEEWSSLSSADRSQRALDRYLRSRMTPWQLGRDYERYVGYLREQAGCAVAYLGIVKGFEDLGRDVIAERDGAIEVIQCKRWAQRKQIHEKHIFQLFGTMTAARIENPGKQVSGTFTTTTTLSERAREFAGLLDIKVEESFPLGDYPRIKCNIARRTDERIYHLPFDQQYDSTVVELARGECYVATAHEAEELGFRRAWRWHGQEGATAT